jgi:RNase P subunit RPR2
MQIHCPECDYDGEQYSGVLRRIWMSLARLYGQTNVTCPKCGFHKAFSSDEWKTTHS